MLRRLLPHQRPAFNYALEEPHPALFMEMRLGKTLVTIRRILLYKPIHDHLRVLIIAPNSALPSWEDELRLEKQTDVVYLSGTREQRLALLDEDHIWNLMNCEGWRSIPEIADVDWDTVVLDESTKIKNAKARGTLFFLRSFRDVPHRWALSGLPNPEGDHEFWTQLAWLDGSAFGYSSFWAFRSGMFVTDDHSEWVPGFGSSAKIHRIVRERTLVMRRQDVGVGSRKVYERRHLDLSDDLRKTYRTAEREMVLEYREEILARTFHKIAEYTWCRQMCGGFVQRKLVWQKKIMEIQSLLAGELRNEKVVIWFAFNDELGALANALRFSGIKAGVITGKIDLEARHSAYRQFQTGDLQVLCVQIKCAQHGANFSAADTAIYYSNSPSLEQRAQSEDRILSPTKTVPLLYIDLVVKESVDEDISVSLREKAAKSEGSLRRSLSDAVLRRCR